MSVDKQSLINAILRASELSEDVGAIKDELKTLSNRVKVLADVLAEAVAYTSTGFEFLSPYAELIKAPVKSVAEDLDGLLVELFPERKKTATNKQVSGSSDSATKKPRGGRKSRIDYPLLPEYKGMTMREAVLTAAQELKQFTRERLMERLLGPNVQVSSRDPMYHAVAQAIYRLQVQGFIVREGYSTYRIHYLPELAPAHEELVEPA